MGILDTEASEDESTRKEYPINRPPSHEVNVELTDKGERYRHILDQAQDSDETVRQKWYEWEEHIRQLTLDEVGSGAIIKVLNSRLMEGDIGIYGAVNNCFERQSSNPAGSFDEEARKGSESKIGRSRCIAPRKRRYRAKSADCYRGR